MNKEFKLKLLKLYPFYDKVTGPFCSRVCAGKHNKAIQIGRLAQLVEATDLSSVK